MDWSDLEFSIRKAARILNIDLQEKDMPAYDDYKGMEKLNDQLWAQVRLRNKASKHPRMNRPIGGSGMEDYINVSGFRELDPKDKSAVLQEQQEGITCSPALLELRDWLKGEIQDEIKAHGDYGQAADKMQQWNLNTFSSAIRSMSDDELGHAGILNIIVDVITEKCGR